MTWKNTTLEQFAAIYKLQSIDTEEPGAKMLTLYQFLTGKDPENASMIDLARWSRRNAWLNEYPKNISRWIWCGGLYRVELNPAKLTGDDFTVITAYSGADLIANLPEVMAKLCRPMFGIKDFTKRAEYFRKNMTVWKAYGTAVFFCRLWMLLSAGGLDYSRKQIRTSRSKNQPLQPLPADGLT